MIGRPRLTVVLWLVIIMIGHSTPKYLDSTRSTVNVVDLGVSAWRWHHKAYATVRSMSPDGHLHGLVAANWVVHRSSGITARR